MITTESSIIRDPTAIDNSINCIYDKIYPFFIGYDSTPSNDMNVTFANMDAYGNLMYAGWSKMKPYSTSTGQQGYIALIDQKGSPYWIYMVKDNTLASNSVPFSNVCTYLRH